MTNEQRNRIELLCRQIEVEKDEHVFIQLISELNQLLEICESQTYGFPAIRAGYNPYMVLSNCPQIPQLLTLMIDATEADFGNVQLLDSSRPGLRIVAQQGFGGEFLSYFETVCSGSFSCGAAMNQKARITVSDILTDPLFQDAQTQGVMLRARVRACQSTPLFDAFGGFIGVVSTHFQRPTSFDPVVWKRVNSVITNFKHTLLATIPPPA